MCPIATSQLRCPTFPSGPNAVSHRVPVPIPMSQEKLRKLVWGHRRSKWQNQVHRLWSPDESHPFVSQLSDIIWGARVQMLYLYNRL